LLHHADERRIASRVGADTAQLTFRQVETLPARVNTFSHGSQRLGQFESLAAIGTEQVVSQAFCRLGPDARQPAKCFGQAGYRSTLLSTHDHSSDINRHWSFVIRK
jgi:hypothetical protein